MLRRLGVIVGRKNSGLYYLINNLRNELIVAKSMISKSQSLLIGTKNKKNKICYKNIKHIIDKRNELSHIGYLKRIAKNLAICSH